MIDRHQAVLMNVSEAWEIQISAEKNAAGFASVAGDHECRASKQFLHIKHGVAEYDRVTIDAAFNDAFKLLMVIGRKMSQHSFAGYGKNRKEALDVQSFQQVSGIVQNPFGK